MNKIQVSKPAVQIPSHQGHKSSFLDCKKETTKFTEHTGFKILGVFGLNVATNKNNFRNKVKPK